MIGRYSELVFLLCILIGVFVFWQSAGTMPSSPRYAQVDADLWPRLILVCLGITTSLLLIQKTALALRPDGSDSLPSGESGAYFLRLALIAGMILLYYFGLKYVGFLVATMVFLWAASNILPFRRPWLKLAFAPAFTLGLGLFFSQALSLPLPRGQGVFYTLSTSLF